MKKKLFIPNTWFANFSQTKGTNKATFDFPFSEKEHLEIIALQLLGKRLSDEIKNDKYVIISDVTLSTMHAAKIIASAIERQNSNKADVVWEIPEKVAENLSPTWDEWIEANDKEQKRALLFSSWKERIAKTFAVEDAHIILLPNPTFIRDFLVSMGVDALTVWGMMGDIGGNNAFVFDENQKYKNVLDFSSFEKQGGIDKVYGKTFGEIDDRHLLLEAMLGLTLINLNQYAETLAFKE